jgi:hypothetical protein
MLLLFEVEDLSGCKSVVALDTTMMDIRDISTITLL